MLIIFQLLFLFFSLAAILSVYRRTRAGALSRSSAVFWSAFWLLANIAVWRPNSTTMLANRLGIGRGSDLVIYISIAVLFYLQFRAHIKIEKVNREVTHVVRDKALHAKYENDENTKVDRRIS